MSLEKIQVKIPFASPADFDQEALIPVFHKWIREKSVSGMLIDVVDYTHVFQGPGVVLIGNDVDYYFDHGKGLTGILFSQKKFTQGTQQEVIQNALKQSCHASMLIEQDSTLPSPQFDTSTILVRFPNRIQTPNDEHGFSLIKGDLKKVFDEAFGEACNLEKIGEPREMLTVSVKTNGKSVSEVFATL